MSTGGTDGLFTTDDAIHSEDRDEYIFKIIPAVVLVVCILSILMVIYVKKKRDKSIDKEESLTIDALEAQPLSPRGHIEPITNGLCVIITIGDYQTFNSESKNKNIPIDKDDHNLRQVFNLLNYKIMPSEQKAYWDEHTLISFLENDVMNELLNDEEELKYDGLILCISGHGREYSIVTSDYQCIEKSAIHRLFSIQCSTIREIPRIFIFDSCNGQATRIEIDTVNDGAKGLKLKDLPHNSSWGAKDKNPDYNLVEIHASNIGFQSKYNADNGSYLLYEFSKRITENILNNKKEKLGRTFEKIQNDLDQRGKQHIKPSFDNNTRYLELHINRRLNGHETIT